MSKQKVVLKFGGTSVGDADSIKRVVEIIDNHPAEIKLVVVSAFAGITNKLYKAWASRLERDTDTFDSLIKSIKEQSFDICDSLGLNNTKEKIEKIFSVLDDSTLIAEQLYGLGERISSTVIFDYINNKVIADSEWIDSSEYIYTKGGSKDYELEESYTYKQLEKLKAKLESKGNHTYVMPGFVSTDSYSRPSILGRGGSDFTAAVLSAGISANQLEIWTDVSGMLSADPKRIDNPINISTLTYKEASELAYFGAKVLHPKTILPVINRNIPVIIKNTNKPEAKGTLITATKSDTEAKVKAVSSRGGVTIVNLVSNRMLGAYGFMKKVFEVFDKYRTPVDLVTTTEVSVSLTIDDTEFLSHIEEELSKFSNVSIDRENSSISIIGEGLGLTAGIAAKAFSALHGINVKMVSFGASEINLSLVVDDSSRDEAVKLLHRELIEKQN
jgi:aspartate kinase